MAQRPHPPGDKSAAEPGSRVGAADSVGKARSIAAADAAAAVERTAAASAVAATDKVDEAKAAAAVAAVAGVKRTAAAERIAGIADRLRRGQLTPAQAVEELIEDAVQKSLVGLGEGSPLSQELRTLLTAFAKDDPYLASQINRLGIHR